MVKDWVACSHNASKRKIDRYCFKERLRSTGMLVLTRRVGETLRIGSDVAVTVLETRGRHVRIGVVAPRNVTVHRQELYERLRRERSLRQSTRPPVVVPERV